MATLESPTAVPTQPPESSDLVALVAGQDLNLAFTGCGHRHDIAKGDRYNRGPWPAGESIILPAPCARVFLDAFGPQPGNAGLSGDGRSGRIAGLRRL